MQKTKIDWAHYTLNPVTGCLGPTGTPERPRHCPWCYAHRLARGRLRATYLKNTHVAPGCGPLDPFSPRFWWGRLNEPFRVKKPARIFICSMGELFGSVVPDSWRERVRTMALECHWHKFLVLTKCPQNIPHFWNLSIPNLWVGVSETCEDQDAPLQRTQLLLDRIAYRRFVSYEPLLGEPDTSLIRKLDWVIVGAQTGPGAKKHIPDERWVHKIKDACSKASVPILEKENLREMMGVYLMPQTTQQYPPGLEV